MGGVFRPRRSTAMRKSHEEFPRPFRSPNNLFLACLGILIAVGLLFPYVALIVPGYALATPLRRNRSRMALLWGIAGTITAAVIIFWLSRLFAVEVSHEGPAHRAG
ncbi:MAG: hypothetical protein V4479_15325 [Actinomycetota bacterium]